MLAASRIWLVGMSSNLVIARLWMGQGIVTLLLLTGTLPRSTGTREIAKESVANTFPNKKCISLVTTFIPFFSTYCNIWCVLTFSPGFAINRLTSHLLSSSSRFFDFFDQSVIFWKSCFWQAGHQNNKRVEKSCLNKSILLPIKYPLVLHGFNWPL